VVSYTKEGGIDATSLAELAVMQYNLRATCRCGHTEVIDGIALWWLFERKGRDQSLRKVGQHLICARCLRDGQRVRWPALQQTRDPGSQCGMPCPGPQVWKQLVRRYRT
jgi:hypothetical protein